MTSFIRPIIIALSFAVVAFMLYDILNPRFNYTVPALTTITADTKSIQTDASEVLTKINQDHTNFNQPGFTTDDYTLFNYKALLFSIAVFIGFFVMAMKTQPVLEEID